MHIETISLDVMKELFQIVTVAVFSGKVLFDMYKNVLWLIHGRVDLYSGKKNFNG